MSKSLLILVLLLGGRNDAVVAQEAHESPRGESIYREGRLPSGAALRAERNGAVTQGAAAACVNCHRRSGLGSYEGSVFVPPIIGPYLFRDGAANVRDLTLPHIPGYVPNREAYTEASLAAALRTGIATGGRVLNALMPRYELDDAAFGELSGYLKLLSAGPFPGVSEQTLEFATIVTPDTDPKERAAVLAVLEQFFKVRNAAVASRLQGVRDGAAAEYRATRNWRLHIWQLAGPAETWDAQLQRHLSEEPVFAVVSGLGRATWDPVHRFCERNHVPCLLPNVDLPTVREQDFYPVYFSRGVLLEVDLMLTRLGRASHAGARLVQVYRADDIGVGAATVLTEAARSRQLQVVDRELPPHNLSGVPGELAPALAGVRREDTLILWLRPGDVAALGERLPTQNIYMSGLMADLEEAPLPAAWRGPVHMTYPYDPPDLRRVRENFPHAWFRQHGITVTHDRLQSNTYVACTLIADALDELLDGFVPELLVERLENMLGSRLNTGYFPRLGLASGQRFASKGGYLVSFDAHNPQRVVLDGEWSTP